MRNLLQRTRKEDGISLKFERNPQCIGARLNADQSKRRPCRRISVALTSKAQKNPKTLSS